MKTGAILSYFSLFASIAVALLYTPIMIRLLGQSEYGLYALIGSVAAYFSVMDMGLGNAIVRFTARNRALGDKKEESKLNGIFLILYSIIGLFTVLVGLILFNQIDNIFGSSLNDAELNSAKIMVLILTLNYSISFPLAVFGSIMQAYEKFIIVKFIAIIRIVLVPVITLPLLFLGFGSVTMVVITTVVNILCLLFNVFYCFTKIKVKFYFGKIEFSLLREIIGYSFFVFLAVIVDQIYWNTDQFILGIVSGTIPVAVYAIAMLFVKLYMQFSTSISGLFLPRVSMMVANKVSNVKLTELMIKFGRIQFFILALVLCGFILFGESFIYFWAGSEYKLAYYIVVIIWIPFTIPLIQNVGLSILYAKNLQKFRSVVLIIIALFNIAITIPLAENYGGLGAAIGTAISLSLGNVLIMNIYYHKKIGIDVLLFWRNIVRLTIMLIPALLIGIGINYIIISNTIIMLIIKIIIFTIIYSTISWFFGLNSYEKKLLISTIDDIKRTLNKLLKKIKR